MFGLATAEVADRIFAVEAFLRVMPSDPGQTNEAATCKGLVFVTLYGIYEFAVRSSVRAALDALGQDQICATDLRSEILALVLDPIWTSAGTAGRARTWEKRIELVSAARETSGALAFRDTLFPNDGSHFRTNQLRTIWRVFSIAEPIVSEPRHLGRINELVENRNAIAHGRSTPGEIGRRYSTQDLEKRISDTDSITRYILDTIRQHYVSGGCRSN